MLAEFFDRLRALSVEANGLSVKTISELPESVFVREGASHRVISVPPTRRHHTVNNVLGLTNAVLSMAKDGETTQLFHDVTRVVAHLDMHDRRDTMGLPLCMSAAYNALCTLAEGRRFSPKDAVNFLRFELPETGADVDALAAVLQNVKHQTRIDGGAIVQHGRESMGRSVEAEVSNSDRIPQEVVVRCSAYCNLELVDATQVSVLVGVILHADTAASRDDLIELRIIGDSLDHAMESAQFGIGAELQKAMPKASVIYGCP